MCERSEFIKQPRPRRSSPTKTFGDKLFCFLADRLFVYFFFGKKKYYQKTLDSFFFFATIWGDVGVASDTCVVKVVFSRVFEGKNSGLFLVGRNYEKRFYMDVIPQCFYAGYKKLSSPSVFIGDLNLIKKVDEIPDYNLRE